MIEASYSDLTSCVQQRRRIPPEVTDLIIACVGLEPNDRVRRRTLLACTLVCSDWLPASRLHLFKKVKFCWYAVTSMDRFLAMDFRSQSMQLQLSRTSEITFESGGLRRTSPSLLHRLAGHFPNIERLTFKYAFDMISAPSQPHPSTFTIFSGFPALHTLILRDCTLPSFNALCRMITAVLRLATLDLDAVTWPQPKRLILPYRTAPRRRPAIVTLKMRLQDTERQSDLFQWLCTTSTTRSMKHLLLRDNSCGMEFEEDGKHEFLRMSAPSIRVLHYVDECTQLTTSRMLQSR